MHAKFVINVLCAMVAAVGLSMLFPAGYSLFADDGLLAAFLLPAVLAAVGGTGSFFLTRERAPYVSIRDVFLMVVLGWIAVALVGSAPFVLSGTTGYVEALFDSMAGFTTTGASTLSPEEIPPSLLLWRSMSQWIGGIGIVLLFVAVAPLAGFGASNLFSAEMANPIPERMTPRIGQTAKILSYVYLGLTLGGIA
ncbi:MAG: hypothetical protein H0V53_10205, partial [Rubrobacter sp.]|nr:hypothetical protein [Rubrobacter sp.]